jgi:hypothetical protein
MAYRSSELALAVPTMRFGVLWYFGQTWAANAPSEDLALYKAAPTEVNVWGQGAALRFAAERVRADLP